MAYESELIKRDELKVGEVYRKELLDFYAEDYKCLLVIQNYPLNVFVPDGNSNYRVELIMSKCMTRNPTGQQSFFEKIIVIKRV